MTNKYGGINDMPKEWYESPISRSIYNLWYGMLRRCYDEEQQQRKRGRAYADCSVCSEWMRLSNFARDVVQLAGYTQWVTTHGMVLDKDILRGETKEYSKSNCCFVPSAVNLAYMNRTHPNITKNANESHKVRYALIKDGERYEFDSEKEACEFIGAKKCTVASCYRYGCKCKGYDVERIGAMMKGADDETD